MNDVNQFDRFGHTRTPSPAQSPLLHTPYIQHLSTFLLHNSHLSAITLPFHYRGLHPTAPLLHHYPVPFNILGYEQGEGKIKVQKVEGHSWD